MISLTPIRDIDDQFLAIAESVLNNTVKLNTPPDVYVVLIDNWFDHKWLELVGLESDEQ